MDSVQHLQPARDRGPSISLRSELDVLTVPPSNAITGHRGADGVDMETLLYILVVVLVVAVIIAVIRRI
jgi:hypothetical protein